MKKYCQYYQFPIRFTFCILALIGLLGYWLIGLFSLAFAQATYPIAELGNCRDATECYLYCEIPENTPACWSYGKYVLNQNVLGEQTASESAVAKRYGITFPIAELGNCANVTECKSYCNNPVNRDACTNFAKSHGMVSSNKTLEDASQELGCNTQTACKAFCEQNHEKCMAFAKKHNLGQTVTTKKGPGGCDSETSCRQYCQQHPNECKGFAASNGGSKFSGSQKSGDYLGPGGCKTGTECKQYCLAHPSECPGFLTTPTQYPKPTSYQTYPTPPAGGYPKPTSYQTTPSQSTTESTTPQ